MPTVTRPVCRKFHPRWDKVGPNASTQIKMRAIRKGIYTADSLLSGPQRRVMHGVLQSKGVHAVAARKLGLTAQAVGATMKNDVVKEAVKEIANRVGATTEAALTALARNLTAKSEVLHQKTGKVVEVRTPDTETKAAVSILKARGDFAPREQKLSIEKRTLQEDRVVTEYRLVVEQHVDSRLERGENPRDIIADFFREPPDGTVSERLVGGREQAEHEAGGGDEGAPEDDAGGQESVEPEVSTIPVADRE